MKSKIITTLFLLTCLNAINAQPLSYNEMKEGEIYYVTFENMNNLILKFEGICQLSWGDPGVSGVAIKGYYRRNTDERYLQFEIVGGISGGCTYNLKGQLHRKMVYPATQEEKDWLNACIEAGKFIPKEEALKNNSKNRGEVKSALIDLNRTALTADYDGIEKEGWQFAQVPFRYQFVNCGGEVQMGVSYDKTTPLVSALDNGIRLVHKGKVYYKSDAEDIWPESKDIEIGDIKATLYFQNLPLGDVKLNNIVGNFAGCFGETYLVLNDVGKNPSDKLYRDNLDKFELRNIKIIRGDVNLSYKRKQEIIKAISYDSWGNPKSNSRENSSTSGKQYDAFGNPIKTKFPNQTQPNTESKQNTKYDAFGNPIKN